MFYNLRQINGDIKEKRWAIEGVSTPYPKYCVIWAGPFLPFITAYHCETAKAVLSTSGKAISLVICYYEVNSFGKNQHYLEAKVLSVKKEHRIYSLHILTIKFIADGLSYV